MIFINQNKAVENSSKKNSPAGANEHRRGCFLLLRKHNRFYSIELKESVRIIKILYALKEFY